MKFLLEDAKDRYKDMLTKMASDRMTAAGDNWDKALLGFFSQLCYSRQASCSYP